MTAPCPGLSQNERVSLHGLSWLRVLAALLRTPPPNS